MPRVSLDPIQRKQWELKRYILGEMRMQKISQKALGEELGMTQQGVAYLIERGNFPYPMLLKIFKVLKTDEETKARLLTV